MKIGDEHNTEKSDQMSYRTNLHDLIVLCTVTFPKGISDDPVSETPRFIFLTLACFDRDRELLAN